MRRFSHGKFRSSGLRVAILARRFALRQGLWIEDLQIPPGQECSNGSLILIAVVLWRTFTLVGRNRRAARRAVLTICELRNSSKSKQVASRRWSMIAVSRRF